MYHCPHCDEGPFSAADWWDHVGLHNAPWLQSRDPQNLERTDLGYGEDIQGMTTVPTHDMPNEPGFNPEKFGALEPHKKLWPGGWKLHTSWLYNRDTGELVSSFSHGDEAQYHFQMFGNGILPGISEDDLYDPDIYRRLALGHLYKTTEGDKIRWSLAYGSDATDPDLEDEQSVLSPAEKEDIRNQFNEHLKNYKEAAHWKESKTKTAVVEPQDYAKSLVTQGMGLGFDIKTLFAWVSQRLIEDMRMTPDEAHLLADEIIPHVQTMHSAGILGPIPQAHKMVWLSQPNNDDLKYWHHNPSNTTYAWESKYGMPGDIHHPTAADTIEKLHGTHPFFGKSNDWEGGFYSGYNGKHPADLWGLPSQVDYAPIQGGY